MFFAESVRTPLRIEYGIARRGRTDPAGPRTTTLSTDGAAA